MPKCVVCDKRIKSHWPRSYVSIFGKKYYGCWGCNTSREFDKWIDLKYEQAEPIGRKHA